MNRETIIKWGLAGIAVIAGGFLAAFIIKSIVALAVLVFGGLFIINMAPLFAHWMAQMKIKGFLWLAATNPVEELVKQYNDKSDRLEEAAKAIAQFGTETKNYGDQVKDFARRRPEKAADFKATHDKMLYVYNHRVEKLQKSKAELKKFEAVIEEARDIWAMTQAAIKANKLLSKFTQGDPMEEIRQKTALNSVYSSLNQVMSELDTAMAMDYESIAQPKVEQIAHQPAAPGFESLFQDKLYVQNSSQPIKH